LSLLSSLSSVDLIPFFAAISSPLFITRTSA
jgi:hypothetical protein